VGVGGGGEGLSEKAKKKLARRFSRDVQSLALICGCAEVEDVEEKECSQQKKKAQSLAGPELTIKTGPGGRLGLRGESVSRREGV